jgi:signal transduction histidine kinase
MDKVLVVLLLSFVPLLAQATEPVFAWVKKASVNRQETPVTQLSDRQSQLSKLQTRTTQIRFEIDVSDRAQREAVRVQYKLEGFDRDWRELAGIMRLTLYFFDGKNNVTQIRNFDAKGSSQGWNTAWKISPLVSRCERVNVPEETKLLHIVLASGGVVEAVGIMAIDDIKIAVQETQEVLFSDTFEKGKNMDAIDGSPSGWRKLGWSTDILSVLHTIQPGGTTNHLLGVVDSNAFSRAEWRYAMHLDGAKYAGTPLQIEWKEFYSVGEAIPSEIVYEYIPPGAYMLRLRTVSAMGKVVKEEGAVSFEIPVVFWKTIWFWSLCTAGMCLTGMFTVRRILQARWKHKLDLVERQHMLEQERTRIAQDIHDEVGANLTRIGLLAQSIQEAEPDNTCALAEEIGRTSNMLILTMSEIVWAINPQNDNLEGLINYFGRFAQQFLSDAKIRCRIKLPEEVTSEKISADARRHSFLVFKEILNNIVRHSHAQEVHADIRIEEKQVVFIVTDNGCGFTPPADPLKGLGGNGLQNMRRRVEALAGSISITSEKGKGTSVQFSVPRQEWGL